MTNAPHGTKRLAVIWIIALVLVVTGFPLVIYLMSRYIIDTGSNRERVAKRIKDLSAQVKEQPGNPAPLIAIAEAAKSGYRFERCYALNALGRLGPLARDSLPAIIRGLESDDPFVRDAAAQAALEMKCLAKPATKQLIKLIYDHRNEGAARYAVLALGEIDESSPEVLDVLKYAVEASDSYGKDEARKVYEKLRKKR
jgi:HEAT repeat protein